MSRNSLIYHGGSSNRGTFAPGGSGGGGGTKEYTLAFGFWDIINAVQFLYPASTFTAFGAIRTGYNIPWASHLKAVAVNYYEFQSTTDVEDVTLDVRRITGDGTTVAAINLGNEGVLVKSLTTVFPNTGGPNRYYFNDQDTSLDIAVPAGEMVFAAITGLTATWLAGVTLFLYLEQD